MLFVAFAVPVSVEKFHAVPRGRRFVRSENEVVAGNFLRACYSGDFRGICVVPVDDTDHLVVHVEVNVLLEKVIKLIAIALRERN